MENDEKPAKSLDQTHYFIKVENEVIHIALTLEDAQFWIRHYESYGLKPSLQVI